MPVYTMLPGGGGSGGGKPEQGGAVVPANPVITLSSYDNEIDVEWLDSSVTDVPIDYHIIYWRIGASKPATVKDFTKSVKVTSGTKYSITGLMNDTTIWVCVCSIGTNGVMNASLRNASSIDVGIAHIFTVTDTSMGIYPYNLYFMVMDFSLYKNDTVDMKSLITTNNGTVDSIDISYCSQVPWFGFVHKSLYAFTDSGVQNNVGSSYPGYVIKCPKSGANNGGLTTIISYPYSISVGSGSITANTIDISNIDLDYNPSYLSAIKVNDKYYIAKKTTYNSNSSYQLLNNQGISQISFLTLDGKGENDALGWLSTYYGKGEGYNGYYQITANDGATVSISTRSQQTLYRYHDYILGFFWAGNYVTITITKVKNIILNNMNTETQIKAINVSKNDWSDYGIVGIWQKRLYIIHRNNDCNLYLTYIDKWGNAVNVCKLSLDVCDSSYYNSWSDVDVLKVNNKLVFMHVNKKTSKINMTILTKDGIIQEYRKQVSVAAGTTTVYIAYMYMATKNNKVIVSRRITTGQNVNFMIGNDFANWGEGNNKFTHRDYHLDYDTYSNRKGQSTTNTEPEYIE